MKQLITKKTFAIACICILCMSWFLLKEEKNALTNLAFSNIEALASGENDRGGCVGRGSVSCNGGYYEFKYYSLR